MQEPSFCGLNSGGEMTVLACGSECRPGEGSRGKIALTADRITPAAVRVRVVRQPAEAVGYEFFLTHSIQRNDGNSRGKGAAAQFSHPVATGIELPQQGSAHFVEGRANPLKIH